MGVWSRYQRNTIQGNAQKGEHARLCNERHFPTLHRLKAEKGNTNDKDKHDHKQNREHEEKDTPSAKTFHCNSTYAGSDVVNMCVCCSCNSVS